MNQYIVIPIKTKALFAPHDMYVANQEANFAETPFFNELLQQDTNADKPHTGDSIMQKEFSSKNLRLKRGLHLHWELPVPAIRGRVVDEEFEFPEIPNRWLVSRKLDGKLKQWIVESDYLYKSSDKPSAKAVTIPYEPDATGTPFRSMGICYGLEAWKEKERIRVTEMHKDFDIALQKQYSDMEYFKSSKVLKDGKDNTKGLTVLGYGNNNFTTYYPNCHSVLGFFDPDIASEDVLKKVSYEIVGWYDNEREDPINKYFQSITEFDQNDFEENFGFKLVENTSSNIKGLISFSKLSFSPNCDTSLNLTEEDCAISVGVSGPETLAARIVQKIEKENIKPGVELEDLEHKIEGLQLFSQLKSQSNDFDQRFNELRHASEFQKEYGGSVWEISIETLESKKAANEKITIPNELTANLYEFNNTQKALDTLHFQLAEMETQLFSDWYKYAQAIYPVDTLRARMPDVEKLKVFINKTGILPLKIEKRTLILLQSKHKTQQEALLLSLYNESEKHKSYKLKLIQRMLPSFYEAKEPEVLVEGKIAKKGWTGNHTEQVFTVALNKNGKPGTWPSHVLKQLSEISGKANFDEWTQQPWAPYFLDWETSFYTSFKGANHNRKSVKEHGFSEEFLKNTYESPYAGENTTADWQLKKGEGKISTARMAYSGRTFMAPSSSTILKDRLTKFISEQYKLSSETSEGQLCHEHFTAQLEQDKKVVKETKDTIRFYISCLKQLETTAFLSQSIGGFNAGLLQRKSATQLSIEDAVNFAEFRDFSALKISPLIEDLSIVPNVLQTFHPFRAGCMKIANLSLMDSFGRTTDVKPKKVFIPSRLKVENNPNLIKLLPRLAQPARPFIRWEDEGLVLTKTNEWKNKKTLDNPICGWVMLNRFNNSIMIFDTEAKVLGQFIGSDWLSENEKTELEQFEATNVANKHLKKITLLLRDIIQKGGFSKLERELDNALKLIQPEGTKEMRSNGLLSGQPLAVVQATVGIELKGGKVRDESWEAFQLALDLFFDKANKGNHNKGIHLFYDRPRANYDKVKIPSLIGGTHKLNDGLVAFIKDEYESNTPFDTENFKILNETQPGELTLRVHDTPSLYTMLVDPLGLVHLTTGILPVIEKRIPEQYYKDVLKKMEFVSLPMHVLTPKDQLELPLDPKTESTWVWTWKDEKGEKQEVDTEGFLEEERFKKMADIHALFDSTDTNQISLDKDRVWDELKSKKWIKADFNNNSNRYSIAKGDDKKGGILTLDKLVKVTDYEKYKDLAETLSIENVTEQIALLLSEAETRIKEVKYKADIESVPNIIRVGHLKLNPKK